MSVAHGEYLETLEEEHGVSTGRSMGWWGMILFIASEALIFANFIAAYLYLEIRNWNTMVWKLPSDITYPIINTLILIASSFPAHMAGRGIARGNQRQLKIGLALTILMGAIFLGGQIYEYSGLFGVHNFTPSASIFGSAFYTLTGFHGLHVTVGAIFLLICLIRSMRGDFTAKNHFAVQAAEMYWHFVDIVWIVVFSLIYLSPLLLPH
ncbi:MAG TPA: heme-copper oxidase subunit III [Ktedonobacteraceae bacterium]|jgi:cytochrome c oxidase subunit 3|nr:heme-copper oxidase subunit III [Ktedonobacteraceae bacterium]